MTAPNRPKSLAEQEARVASMKSMLKNISTWNARSAAEWNRLYSMVHHWTEDAVVLGMAPSTNEACLKLAKTMKVSYPTAFGWYQVGKVINENRLPFDSVGVSALRKNMAHISKATTLKCIQAIKDGARRGSVTRIIAKDRMYDKSLINARLSRLTRENKLTKTHLQMEMMALLTMARKVFKREDIIITITDTAFVPLCAVGDGKSGAEKNIA